MPRPSAVAAMHKPEDKDHWSEARRTLAYEECLLMQLAIGLTRLRQISRPAHPLAISDEIDRRIRARFPFELTPAQVRGLDAESAKLLGAGVRPKLRTWRIRGDIRSFDKDLLAFEK